MSESVNNQTSFHLTTVLRETNSEPPSPVKIQTTAAIVVSPQIQPKAAISVIEEKMSIFANTKDDSGSIFSHKYLPDSEGSSQIQRRLSDQFESKDLSKQSTPAIDSKKSTPAIDSKKSTPAIDSKKSTPAIDPKNNTPAIDSKQSTPAIDSKQNTPTIDSKQSTPAIDSKKSTPAIDSKKSTPAEVQRNASDIRKAKQVSLVIVRTGLPQSHYTFTGRY